MKRIIWVEEEVAQSHRHRVPAERSLSPLGGFVEIGRVRAEAIDERLLPDLILPHGMGLVLSQPLHRVPQHVDAVARREVEIELMRLLEEIDRQVEHLGFGERQVIAQDRQLVIAIGMTERECRLQSAEDVVGDFKRRFIVIHRDGTAKVAVRANLDPRHDRLHIPAMIE